MMKVTVPHLPRTFEALGPGKNVAVPRVLGPLNESRPAPAEIPEHPWKSRIPTTFINV